MTGWKYMNRISSDNPDGPMHGFWNRSHDYVLMEWTTRRVNHGPMCLYTSIAAARKGWANAFQASMYDEDLYECEYEPSDGTLLYCPGWRATPLSELPNGTVLADRIMPIRREYLEHLIITR